MKDKKIKLIIEVDATIRELKNSYKIIINQNQLKEEVIIKL